MSKKINSEKIGYFNSDEESELECIKIQGYLTRIGKIPFHSEGETLQGGVCELVRELASLSFEIYEEKFTVKAHSPSLPRKQSLSSLSECAEQAL